MGGGGRHLQTTARLAWVMASACLCLATFPVRAAVLFADGFDYASGALTNVSDGRWVLHSGNSSGVFVRNGYVELNSLASALSDDVSVGLCREAVLTGDGVTLYAKLRLTQIALPTGKAGGYFAHFMDGTRSYRARLYAVASTNLSGAYRLGIANSTGTPALSPLNLSLNVPVTAVIAFDVDAGQARLWIDATSTNDTPVVATDDPAPAPVTSFALRQSLSQGAGPGMQRIDQLTIATSFAGAVATAPKSLPPAIIVEPQSATLATGMAWALRVVVSGDPELTCQWFRDGVALGGKTNTALSGSSFGDDNVGSYQLVVTNRYGVAESESATLSLLTSDTPVPIRVAALRKLVDPVNLQPTDRAHLYQVEGVVTTHANLAASPTNVLFYLQDDAAGVAVQWTGRDADWEPAAGERVRVVARLTSFYGLLELRPDLRLPETSVNLLARNAALPTALALDFGWQEKPALLDGCEGRRVVARKVWIEQGDGVFPDSGTLTMTNQAGAAFALRVDARTDLPGQPIPSGPVDIDGVLGQYDASDPRTAGYQLIPTRYADIVPVADTPEVRLQIQPLPGSGLRITWSGGVETTYTLWQAERVDGPYQVMATDLPAGQRDISIGGLDARFYRVSCP